MNANNGIITQPSPYSVTETIDRLEAMLQAKGITIFARIDQRAEAKKVGHSLRPTQLLLFGNPKAGTPLMQKHRGYCTFSQSSTPINNSFIFSISHVSCRN